MEPGRRTASGEDDSDVTRVYDLDHPHALALDDLKALVGGKAANLNVMATRLGLPVPPGFVLTTATCNAYLAGGWPDGLDAEVRAHMAHVEAVVGRRFGDPADPLLVSVRSGAPVSMPGMMDTILNLGLDDATVGGLGAASGDAAFAADCRRRFVEMFRSIVGVAPPDDPWLQLRAAIEAVFRSWNSDRARAYRQHEGIPDDLGTAVTVQAMVFGNRGGDSGTGVLFTRNPASGEPVLYGDVMFDAQGEDVVAGTHRTLPIGALDERLPEVARRLREYAALLERHYADLCDIEFTIESGRLWMLQVRVGKRSPRAALRIALDMANDPDFPLGREEAILRVSAHLAHPPLVDVRRDDRPAPLTMGLAASPGTASGQIVTSPDAAEVAADAGRSVLLVRSETSPEDVHGMATAAGILTARGGLASHAAVVARGWGIPAVVGAAAVEVGADRVVIGGWAFAAGEVITIDGSTGEVFAGEVSGSRAIAPEAKVLLAWAAELGIAVGGPDDEGADAGVAGRAGGPGQAGRHAAGPAAGSSGPTVDPGLVARALLVKGHATLESLALAFGTQAEQLRPMVDHLVAAGIVETAPAGLRLTGPGKLHALGLFASDRDETGGEAACVAALDEFLELDRRMKDTVTAWQLREVDGRQVINDHGDDRYDAGVLERLAGLHADTDAWLAPVAGRLARLAAYRRRLQLALDLAREGDRRFVASPLVDSYHGVWFELHEDLIRLAGRRRSDEAAASRA
jgi:pyruvate,orthophosphate dikinase